MANKSKFAFRDIRKAFQLLGSGRPPKTISIQQSNPVSKKLTTLTSDAKKKTGGGFFGKLKKFAVKYAAKAALGPAGYAAFKLIEGKFNISGRIGGAIAGKLGKKPVGSLGDIAKTASIGVKIVEETDPEKIRRPLISGFSTSPSVAAKSLSETAAKSVNASLVSGIPLASAIPTPPRDFKTTAALVRSPRFWNPGNASFELNEEEVKQANNAVEHVSVSVPDAVLYPQRGLLEDEIMYRLTLLAENVYAPTQAYAIQSGYGGLHILEGFRGENTGTSPHETGEALDFTLGNGSLAMSAQCFELAQWMRDHILYDQLILCFSPIAGGQVWIHVSFTPDARRRQVWTKPFNDLHVEGLHLYGHYSSSAAQNADASYIADLNTTAESFMDVLTERQDRAEPVSVNTINPVQTYDNTITTGTASGDTGDDCSSDCLITQPDSFQWAPQEEVISVANQVKSELIALGMTFKTPDELGQALELGFDEYHRELEKYMCIAVPTVRRLNKTYPSVGLEVYGGPSGTEYNSANNRYYDLFGSKVADGKEPLPVGLKLYFDGILLSKNGPAADFISGGGGIYFGPSYCAATIPEWRENWRNPWDGTTDNYPTDAKYDIVKTKPEGCLGK